MKKRSLVMVGNLFSAPTPKWLSNEANARFLQIVTKPIVWDGDFKLVLEFPVWFSVSVELLAMFLVCIPISLKVRWARLAKTIKTIQHAC